MSDAPVIVWFRRDLRLADNPALAAAVETGAPIIPLYVLDGSAALRPLGAASLWWLDKSLRALDADLRSRGSRLILRRGAAETVIPDLARETGATAVHRNRLWDPGLPQRDAALQEALGDEGVEALSFNAALLLEPGKLTTKTGGTYSVFTPFWRAARAAIRLPAPTRAPDKMTAPEAWPASDALEDWRLHPDHPDWSAGFDVWSPGEDGAHERLHLFIEDGLRDYARGRDTPSLEGSTRLSPHLHWGEISPAQVWRSVQAAVAIGEAQDAQADKLFSEMAWRDFNHHLLAVRPTLADQPVKAPFARMPWRSDAVEFRAWTRGRTGYPIVDAGMRQLWETGWMHNRVRLIAASFLVKHLLHDWREGERWFWNTLVDADAANNAANWQWVAGSGVDAAPFFRIFNPTTQGERFDPDGLYVKRWAPELANVPAKVIHQPWAADPMLLSRAGVKLGRDYPLPIVDHAAARARALDALRGLRDVA